MLSNKILGQIYTVRQGTVMDDCPIIRGVVIHLKKSVLQYYLHVPLRCRKFQLEILFQKSTRMQVTGQVGINHLISLLLLDS